MPIIPLALEAMLASGETIRGHVVVGETNRIGRRVIPAPPDIEGDAVAEWIRRHAVALVDPAAVLHRHALASDRVAEVEVHAGADLHLVARVGEPRDAARDLLRAEEAPERQRRLRLWSQLDSHRCYPPAHHSPPYWPALPPPLLRPASHR